MVCAKRITTGGIGSSYFAGWALVCLIIPVLSDRIGRKWIFVICTLFTGLAMFIILLSKRIWLTTLMMFSSGALNGGRLMVGFIYA